MSLPIGVLIAAFSAMFLGVWFNKEKINWHQYLGAAMAIFASIALAVLV